MCYLLRRFCENNPDSSFANCEVAQELSNEEIDKQLADDEVFTCHQSEEILNMRTL